MPDTEREHTQEEGNALFNSEPYLIRVQGNRDYLPVAARVKWFRLIHPLGSITTEEVEVLLDFQPPASGNRAPAMGYARFHATVKDAESHVLGEGTKTETAANFPDYAEKAETGAIGRALAVSGFGTPLDADLDEGRVVDAPRARVPRGQTTRRTAAPAGAGRTEQPTASPVAVEERVRQKLRYLESLARRLNYATLQDAAEHYGWNWELLQADEGLMGVAHGVMTGAVALRAQEAPDASA